MSPEHRRNYLADRAMLATLRLLIEQGDGSFEAPNFGGTGQAIPIGEGMLAILETAVDELAKVNEALDSPRLEWIDQDKALEKSLSLRLTIDTLYQAIDQVGPAAIQAEVDRRRDTRAVRRMLREAEQRGDDAGDGPIEE